jgi:hypothetical protein
VTCYTLRPRSAPPDRNPSWLQPLLTRGGAGAQTCKWFLVGYNNAVQINPAGSPLPAVDEQYTHCLSPSSSPPPATSSPKPASQPVTGSPTHSASAPTEFTPTEASPSTDVTSPPTAFTPTESTDGKDDEDETGHALVGMAKHPQPPPAAAPAAHQAIHSDDPVRHPPSLPPSTRAARLETLTQSFLSSYAQGSS